jgi:hypothetical protein
MTAGDGTPADGTLMRLVGSGLEAHGFDIEYKKVRDPALGAGSTLTFGGLEGMRCWVSVANDGLVEWEWFPEHPRLADAGRIGNLVVSVLAGRNVDCSRDIDKKLPTDLVLKGTVAHYLKASGLQVSLDVYEDTDLYEATSEISVTSPDSDLKVSVGDDGAVIWQHDFWPDYPDGDIEHIAKTIVGTVAHAATRAIGDG